MLNTTWTETYMCVPLYFILRRYRYFWWSSYNVATEFSLCYQSCNWHRGSALSNATLRWKCRDSRLVAKKQKTKCYSSWTRLYNRGNTSSKMLPRQDECCPRLYLGKDEVECGNTASLTRGGPAARTREMGQYFQAVLYVFTLPGEFWVSLCYLALNIVTETKKGQPETILSRSEPVANRFC